MERFTPARLFSRDWWAVCLGTFAISVISITGDLGIGLYLLCCIDLFTRHINQSIRTLVRFLPLLGLPALAMFSTMWSDAPSVSMKQGAELMLFFITAIVLCRRIPLNHMAAALQLSLFVCCALCLAVQPTVFKSDTALRGILGSKNEVSFTAQILLISSLSVGLDSTMPRLLRFHSLVAAGLAGLEIYLARSAGGTVTSVAAVAALLGLALARRVEPGQRIALVLVGLLAVAPMAFVAKDAVDQVRSFQTNVLHKDSTLTGRTELWTFAWSLIAERPILGHGFSAFWRQGNTDAEGLWQRFGIGGRAGFNFHNQFMDTLVDTGWIGLAALITTLAAIAAPAIWRSLTKPTNSAIFGTSILVALYLKLPVESVLIGSWNIYTIALIATALNALGKEAPAAGRAPRPSGAGSWRQTGGPASRHERGTLTTGA